METEWGRKPWTGGITWVFSLGGQGVGLVLAAVLFTAWWVLPIGQMCGLVVGLALSELAFRHHLVVEGRRFRAYMRAKYPDHGLFE